MPIWMAGTVLRQVHSSPRMCPWHLHWTMAVSVWNELGWSALWQRYANHTANSTFPKQSPFYASCVCFSVKLHSDLEGTAAEPVYINISPSRAWINLCLSPKSLYDGPLSQYSSMTHACHLFIGRFKLLWDIPALPKWRHLQQYWPRQVRVFMSRGIFGTELWNW